MEATIVEIAKWFFSRSDPMLCLAFLCLAYWQYKTSVLLNRHIDPDNENPHTSCKLHEQLVTALGEQLEKQHQENREDFQNLTKTLLEISGRKR